MHFVTGGSYNGKAKWVREQYQVTDETIWLSAYQDHDLPENMDHHSKRIILEGIERWIKQDIQQFNAADIRASWKLRIERFLNWEKENEDRHLIIIGNDLSKGIVPIEASDRTWRDACGWVYQDLAERADRVELIWYGINQQLK